MLIGSSHVGMIGGKNISCEFLYDYFYNSNLQTFTFSSVPFGTATADRLIVACFSGYRNTASSMSTCTIGGVSATIHVQQINPYSMAYVCSAIVPAGTSGDIVAYFPSYLAASELAVYSIKDYTSATPYINEYSYLSGSTPTITISPDANSIVIGNAAMTNGVSTTWSGTAGLTEYSDNGDYYVFHSTAMKKFSSAASSVTVTATPSGGTTQRNLQVLAWK